MLVVETVAKVRRLHFVQGLAIKAVCRELGLSLKEAQIIIEGWRRHHNAVRPHTSLGYRPPAPEVFVPSLAAWPSALVGAAPTATLGLAPRPVPN